MTIKNNILRDYSEEDERFYLIDLITGVKAEVIVTAQNKKKATLLRSEIEKEDIERAISSNADLQPLKKAKNSQETIIKSMKRIANYIERGEMSMCFPALKKVEFTVGDYKYHT